ncbi:MAG: hypothetical protein BECKG1743D_GA0114223_103304 [Candidatus Kentron sp. G]|nr:MAG: hypothetical protein BECKG1743D_GA0114223_103304 [Candidatus Kentron sp. G]
MGTIVDFRFFVHVFLFSSVRLEHLKWFNPLFQNTTQRILTAEALETHGRKKKFRLACSNYLFHNKKIRP